MSAYINSYKQLKASEYFRLYKELRDSGVDPDQIMAAFERANPDIWYLILMELGDTISEYEAQLA